VHQLSRQASPSSQRHPGVLLHNSDERAKFSYIEPPFNLNAPDVATYPPEVSGLYLLRQMRQRLGWPALAKKRLLDFGCGVRFARTIVNLGLEIGAYAGIDVQRQPIEWLRANVSDPHLRFEHFNIRNARYNPRGEDPESGRLADAGLIGFDAAAMFSVITHQNPDEALKTFKMLYPCVKNGGGLYFTAFVDEAVDGYVEGNPQMHGHKSTYCASHLLDLLSRAGWVASDIYPPSQFALTAFVCWKQG
jgi:SAM-dependent methyltransferase